MHLRLFRSLVGRTCRLCPLDAVTRLDSTFSGCELTLAQLEATPAILRWSSDSRKRLVVQVDAEDVDDVGSQLDRLSSQLCKHPNVVELVVLVAPPHDTLSERLDYLRYAQPLWSRFLEAHPSVGSSHGKLNAHGTAPLGNHTHGVVHRLSGCDMAVPTLAEVVEIYTPTRLALSAENLVGTVAPTAQEAPTVLYTGVCSEDPPLIGADGLSEELEFVAHASDLVRLQPADWRGAARAVLPLLDEVWSAQQLDGAAEAYVVCADNAMSDDASAGGASHDGERDTELIALAAKLRHRFAETAGWRAGAADRRAAEAAAARATRQLDHVGPLAAAFDSFGLRPSDLDATDGTLQRRVESRLKARWRQLALQEHPDVQGGSATRFRELKEHYKVLLQAARRTLHVKREHALDGDAHGHAARQDGSRESRAQHGPRTSG